jgi:hypothetical protein
MKHIWRAPAYLLLIVSLGTTFVLAALMLASMAVTLFASRAAGWKDWPHG